MYPGLSGKTAIVTGASNEIGKGIAYPFGIEGMKQLFDAAIQSFSSIDIMVNHAGINIGAPFHELSLNNWRQAVKTNLTRAFPRS